jgi:hypothetical protein
LALNMTAQVIEAALDQMAQQDPELRAIVAAVR